MGFVCSKRAKPIEESEGSEDSHSEGSGDNKNFDVPCGSRWNRFLHEHRGMGLSPQAMSVLYRKARICGELSDSDDGVFSETSVLHVKSCNKTFEIAVDLSKDVKLLKQAIFDKTKIKITDQRLALAGKELEMGRTISSYDVEQHSTLVLKKHPTKSHRSAAVKH